MNLIYIGFIVLFLSGFVQAQQADKKFYPLSSRDALPNNSVTAITQDSSGFMWFGTPNGLCRYDGSRIRVFTKIPNDSTSLSSDEVYSLLLSKDGMLWIGTNNGVNLFNPTKGNFQLYFQPSLPHQSQNKKSAGTLCSTLFEDSDSLLWVGSYQGLFKMTNRKEKKFKKIMGPLFGPAPLEDELFRGICQDSRGYIWVGVGKSIIKFTKEGKKVAEFDYGNFSGYIGDCIRSMTIDHNQNLWIGGKRGKVTRFNCLQNRFENVDLGLDLSLGAVSNSLNEIYQLQLNGRKGLWVVGVSGIVYMNFQSGTNQYYHNDPENPNSLNDTNIMSVFVGRDSITWFGTYNNGISYILPNDSHFQSITAGKNNKLTSSIVSAVSKNQKGEMLIGTNGDGMNVLDLKSKRISTIKDLNHQPVMSILSDRLGDLWTATDGVKRYDAKKKSWKYYQHSETDSNSISSNTVHKILEDSQGNIWLATLKGLDLFDRQTNTFKHIRLTTSRYAAMSIFEDSKGNLWVGTCGEVIYILPKGRQRSYIVPVELHEGADPIATRCIWAIHEDKFGNIWGGGFGNGLKKYNPKKNIMEHFECPGLYDRSNNVMSIQSDLQGRLWLGMTSTIAMVDVNKRSAVHFSQTDGITGTEINLNSSYQDENGLIFLGMNKGLVYFNPNTIKLNTAVPKVVITGLEVSDKTILPGDSSEILKNDMQFTKKLILEHHQNFLKIDFAILNYIHPEKNSFEYRFEQNDKSWHRTSDPWVTFNNLAPGTYNLLVRGYNNDHVMSKVPARLEIIILPPWWQTWWAYLIYSLVLLAIAATIVRLLLIRATYGQTLQLNQYKLDFFTNISHEIRTYLTLISAPLDKAGQNLNVQNNISLAQNNVNKLLALVTELMDFGKLESKQVRLHVEERDIVASIQNLLAVFENLKQEKKINVSVNTSNERILLFYDTFQIEKAIFNLLSNAFKFVKESGNVHIEINETERNVSIKVIDDGRGIADEHIAKLFDNYFQEYEYGDKNTGYGIGLPLSKGIVSLHHGTLTAETLVEPTTNQQRTCFEITLLRGSAHFTPEQLIPTNNLNQAYDVPNSELEGVLDIPMEHRDVETILVAEDNVELSQFIASCFPQYRIIQCHDGLKAWEQSIDTLPDLVITDIMIPGMRGTELCKRLKQDERTSHIPVVMLTAMVANSQVIEGLQSQADHYITKPFHPKELELKVINLLNLRNVVRERAKSARNLGEFEETLSNDRDREFLNKLSEIIERNVSEPDFGVDELVREIGIGRTVFYKKVKAATGMSVNDFVKIIRLNYAAKLLRADVYTVNEVAEMVGFNDRRYFTKEFSRIIGKTPSLYAKEFKK